MKSVFISYSHKDECFKEQLEEHLAVLQNNSEISVWNDRQITAGEEWAEEISDNLTQADIILFLVSPSFLASNYCYHIEAKTALKQHENGASKVIQRWLSKFEQRDK